MSQQAEMDLVGSDGSPASVWHRDAAKRALDDLFHNAAQYKSSKAIHDLLRFVGRFRFYAPFNAMLVHTQMPGATYVAPAHRWRSVYGRRVKAGARPLVILQPMGSVMFVFDVAETEPLPNASPLPPEVEKPFEVTSGRIRGELETTVENAKRDGILVEESAAGSQHAGSIRSAPDNIQIRFQTRRAPPPTFTDVPRRYHLLLNRNLSREARYATLVHELGHLYAGHLGTPNEKWWPDRRGLPLSVREFEAESICYLVCARLGIDNPSDKYLSDYLGTHAEAPQISLDCVMKAAGLIEQMGREHMKVRS
ncbi:ImmA/IrrE family metallo-endopeptidase [Elioraea sp.]|uniref:ImmA/IrrE family metallo-endopeptidase n=1 Tax=Elioraea sp. TaxID=2185103 RepID=UPI003F6F209B